MTGETKTDEQVASLDDVVAVMASVNELLKLAAKRDGYVFGIDEALIV
jgi:hypothetical protein